LIKIHVYVYIRLISLYLSATPRIAGLCKGLLAACRAQIKIGQETTAYMYAHTYTYKHTYIYIYVYISISIYIFSLYIYTVTGLRKSLPPARRAQIKIGQETTRARRFWASQAARPHGRNRHRGYAPHARGQVSPCFVLQVLTKVI